MKNDPTYYMAKHSEGQVIRMLLDSITREERKKYNFGVIAWHTELNSRISMQRKPIDFLAWFKYSHEDKHITVNYFSFPKKEFFEAGFHDPYGMQSSIFYHEIIYSQKNINPETAKQITMPMPAGLQDSNLLKRELRKAQRGLNTLSQRRKVYRGGSWDSYTYGFIVDRAELISDDDEREDFSLTYHEIEAKILTPIAEHIFYRETPDEWKAEWEKYALENNIDITPLNEWLKTIGVKK